MDRIQERIFIVKLINDKNDPSGDLDRFREFDNIGPFDEMFAIPQDEKQKILTSDTELMLFAFRFLRQVLFGENTIALQCRRPGKTLGTLAQDPRTARGRSTWGTRRHRVVFAIAGWVLQQ